MSFKIPLKKYDNKVQQKCKICSFNKKKKGPLAKIMPAVGHVELCVFRWNNNSSEQKNSSAYYPD